MDKISRETAEHYLWQEVCDGWHLVKRDDLSVIAEKMPPHTAEEMHSHEKARQFFYILSGQAVMRLSDRDEHLRAGEGIEIPPLEAHQMRNDSGEPLSFLVVSSPKAHGDRVPAGPDIDTLFFFEGRPNALDLYEALLRELTARFPQMRVKTAKTQISFSNRYLFAAASLPKRKREDHLVVTFGLGYEKHSPRIFSSVEAARGRWTHHVAVREAHELDGELFGWLEEAYTFAMVK